MRNPLARFRVEHLVVIGSVVAVATAALLLAQRPRSLGYDPKQEKQGSSNFSTPLGGKAYYALLEALQLSPFRHERRFELLPPDTRVAMMLGPLHPPEKEDLEPLRDWMRRGGTLVWCPRRGVSLDAADPILSGFGLRLKRGTEDKIVEFSASLRPLDRKDERSYAVSFSRGLRLEMSAQEKGPEALAEDSSGWVAAVVPCGQGRLVALADPDFFANESISRGDNAAFMVRLAEITSGARPIAFDEFHHGFTSGQSAFSIVWDSSLRPVLLLAVLATFFGVFASGRRLGPAVDLHEERRRKPGEFIEAFAALCRKTKAGPQALSMVLAEFRFNLQQAHGAGTPEAIGRVSTRAGLDPQAVAGTIERATRLSKAATAEDAELVSCCRELEQIRASLRKNQVMRKVL